MHGAVVVNSAVCIVKQPGESRCVLEDVRRVNVSYTETLRAVVRCTIVIIIYKAQVAEFTVFRSLSRERILARFQDSASLSAANFSMRRENGNTRKCRSQPLTRSVTIPNTENEKGRLIGFEGGNQVYTARFTISHGPI